MEDFEKYLQEIEDGLKEYETQNAGLPINKEQQAPKCLFMPIEELRKMNPDELADASFVISQYAMYIQRMLNQSRSWEKWLKMKIDEVASDYITQVDKSYGSYERMQIAKHSPALCKKLNSVLRTVIARTERLYSIPENIRFISESIKDIKFSQLRKIKEYGTDR